MKRLVVAISAIVCAASALAMPTSAELKKAQSLVAELMAPAMVEFKSAGAKEKAAAAVKVGDASSEFAKAAETEAVRFLLLKGAVNFYVRGEEYDKAADAVVALQTGVKDVSPEVIAEITGKATGKISETKAPRLFAQYRAAKRQACAGIEARTLARKLKTMKSDSLQRRYAEVLAVSGEFWWTYEPEFEGAGDVFKSHAAAFYRKALDAGEITGLKKNIVEQRVAKFGVGGTQGPSLVKAEDDDDSNRNNERALSAKGAGVKSESALGEKEPVSDDNGVHADIVYELRIVDVEGDGGAMWGCMDKDPGVDMEKFSTVKYAGSGLAQKRLPLSQKSGWKEGRTEYWTRKEFTCPVDPSRLSGGHFLVDADKSVEIWLNGVPVYESNEHAWHYHKKEFDVQAVLKGKNIIAAHVQAPSGGKAGHLDIGVYLQGPGLFEQAKTFVNKKVPLIPVDVNSLQEDDAVVKSGMHGGAGWKYSLMPPKGKWFDLAFDDSRWESGTGGFSGGTRPDIEPTAHTHKWNDDEIWMRTSFDYDKGPDNVVSALLSFRCGDNPERIDIYLNGKKVINNVRLTKFSAASRIESDMWNAFDMTEAVRAAMVKGKNVIAVFARAPSPGLSNWCRCVDVGLYVVSAH